MSNDLQPFDFALAQCERELEDFRALLDAHPELSESDDLLPFFRARPHLIALAGSLNPHLTLIDRVAPEFDLFGNFRCDWIVGDSQSQVFTLIEFEDARVNSIFELSVRYCDDRGQRFEHGFSQLVDWFWMIDAYPGNPDFNRRFGSSRPTFAGLLAVGRRAFLQDHHVERLRWRLDRVLANSQKVTCFTFDNLFDFSAAAFASCEAGVGRATLTE